MAEEATEGLGAGWAAASGAVEAEVAAWRGAHPRATLTEIERVAEAATARLQGWLVEELTAGVAAGRRSGRIAPAAGRRCSGAGGGGVRC